MTQHQDDAPAPGTAATLRRAAVVLAGCGTAFVLIYAVAVLTTIGQRIDSRAMIHAWYVVPALTRFCMRALELYHRSTYALAACAILGWGLVRRGPGRTAVAAATLVGILASAEGLKHALPRPDLTAFWGPMGFMPENSFPSGHTAGIAALAVAAFLVASPARRRLVAVIGALLTAAVGCALVVCQWHRPSDIVGSMLLATGWATVSLTALEAGPALVPALARRRALPASR